MSDFTPIKVNPDVGDSISLAEFQAADSVGIDNGGTGATNLATAQANLGIDTKQDTLVNQVNIKSINGDTLLGSGNLEIAAGSGGYAANVYLTTLVSSTVGTYSQISYTPEVSTTTLNTVVNNNEVLIEDYIFDGDVIATIIPAGVWGFYLNRYVSSASSASSIRFELFTRAAGGAETVLFSVSTKEIDSLTVDFEEVLTTQPTFNVSTTDRVGIRIYAATTSNSNITVSLMIGDGKATYFTTPLELRHSQLRARDGADSHPIDAITGLTSSLAAINTTLSFFDAGNITDPVV